MKDINVGDYVISKGKFRYGITNENGIYKVIDKKDNVITVVPVYYRGSPDNPGFIYKKDSLLNWCKINKIMNNVFPVDSRYFRKIKNAESYAKRKNSEFLRRIPKSNFKNDIIKKGMWG